MRHLGLASTDNLFQELPFMDIYTSVHILTTHYHSFLSALCCSQNDH